MLFEEPIALERSIALNKGFFAEDAIAFAELEEPRRRRTRRARRVGGACFVNPRTGVRMRALGGRRGFARC